MVRAAFHNLPSEEIVSLIDGLKKDSFFNAIDVLLSREKDGDLIWQIKGLQKLSRLKRQGKKSWLQKSEALKGLIKKYIKDKIGDAQLYALIALVDDTQFSLPDELVKRLVLTHQSNHWIPLLTEQQRLYCFNALLRSADNYTTYINLVSFLSVSKEQAQIETKQIVDDLLQKYPHIFSNDFNKRAFDDENLAVLRVLPVFILCLNDKNHSQILDAILPKFNDENASVRITVLKVLAICIPYFNEQDRLIAHQAVQNLLEDKDRMVRLEAQQAINKCTRYITAVSKSYPKLDINALELFLNKLQDGTWLIAKEVQNEIVGYMHSQNEEGQQKIIDVMLLKIEDGNWQVRKSALKIIADCTPHIIDETLCLQVFHAIIPHLNDTIWFIYSVVLEAIAACMPKLKDEQHQQVLELILPTVNDNDWSSRYVVLEAMQRIVPHLHKKYYPQLLSIILPRLNDNHSIARGMALQVLFLFIDNVSVRSHQQILAAILPRLNETNSYVSHMARRLIIKFMPCLNDKRRQEVLDILLAEDFDEEVLQDMVQCVPHLREKDFQRVLKAILPRLNDSDWRARRSVIRVLTACMSYLKAKPQQEVLDLIFPKLNDEYWEVCEEALKAILTCSLYLQEKNRDLLHLQLNDYLLEKPSWDDEMIFGE